ncbi:uncharacterized protein LOC116059182 isoform X2 [Sander lucioperca]|uniref:uncharacterized protein LOC116059182 isoform X2 n=1 Tax=Sander lucioperca TaxID=283035 RepID=UPI00125D9564|nr:uncharacterized protein LOC116059182 isoform X2 [Sander lucioperca]
MENRRIHLACGSFCTYIAVIAVFILFGRDFECTCQPQVLDCNVYLYLPAFIVYLLILWTDGSFRSVYRLLCRGVPRGTHTHTCSFWGSLFYHIFKAAFIGLLWVVVVLIDGDWYVCCQNDRSEQQRQLACKAVGRITEEERVTIAKLRNMSRVFGSFLFLVIVCVPFLMAYFRWTLSRAIEDRVRRNRWEECCNVAADLITSEENFPEHEEQQQTGET